MSIFWMDFFIFLLEILLCQSLFDELSYWRSAFGGTFIYRRA